MLEAEIMIRLTLEKRGGSKEIKSQRQESEAQVTDPCARTLR